MRHCALWLSGTATQSWRDALTASKDYRSRSASRPRAGAPRSSRHRQRLAEIAPRMDVGQLCGGVGSLSSLGPRAFEIQERFLSRLGLRPPEISWTSSRDVLAEWCNLMVLITATADRIGHEVYNLQRSEIGEVVESFMPGTVGSITMPHKRNPELCRASGHAGTGRAPQRRDDRRKSRSRSRTRRPIMEGGMARAAADLAGDRQGARSAPLAGRQS